MATLPACRTCVGRTITAARAYSAQGMTPLRVFPWLAGGPSVSTVFFRHAISPFLVDHHLNIGRGGRGCLPRGLQSQLGCRHRALYAAVARGTHAGNDAAAL